MYTLTAADFADTGQWRLLLEIKREGLEAFLENTLHPELPPQPFCSASWETNRDNLRNNIEEAVYGNPRLLDDFATRIILYDPCTLFIPTRFAEDSIGAEAEIYNEVYTAEANDVMTETDADVTAAWHMAPGIKGFLMRTFPGARITCNLMEKVKKQRLQDTKNMLSAFARDGECDIVFTSGKELISASTHEYASTDDIAYLIYNLMQVYDVKPEETNLHLYGADDHTDAWQYLKNIAGSFRLHSDNFIKNEDN